MPLNVQDLIDELDPTERRKVDELTAKLEAEYGAYRCRSAPAAASRTRDPASSQPVAASPSKRP